MCNAYIGVRAHLSHRLGHAHTVPLPYSRLHSLTIGFGVFWLLVESNKEGQGAHRVAVESTSVLSPRMVSTGP